MEQHTLKLETPGTYNIWNGKAFDAKAEPDINIAGTLSAPYDFLIGRGDIKQNEAHLLIDRLEGAIELTLNDRDPYSQIVINGSLTEHPELQKFFINVDTRWRVSEFLKFCKVMRYYFDSREQHAALIQSLQNWSVKIEKVIKETTENSGSYLFHLENKVKEVELKRFFDLRIPIFTGQPVQKFQVEICLDTKSNGVDLYLISDDLLELEIATRETLIEKEVAKFAPYTFAKVYIS